jgi:hypothetical protein
MIDKFVLKEVVNKETWQISRHYMLFLHNLIMI